MTSESHQQPSEEINSQRMDRRQMLWHAGGGLGGIALASLLGEEGLLAAPGENLSKHGGLHHKPKAKRVIQLFMSGAASQCDTFDYKPLLVKNHGKKWDPGQKVELFQSSPGKTMMSPWPWKQYGESGKWVNQCVESLGQTVDEMAFIHNMVTKSKCARASNVHAGHRIHSPRLSRHGLVGQLWIGQHDTGSTDVCRIA